MAFLIAAIFSIAVVTCDDTITTETTYVVIVGDLPIEFAWHDGRTDCPECYSVYATVRTPKEDYDYGPYLFEFGGVTLEDVLAGSDQEVIVWVTESTGSTKETGAIYHGVAEHVPVTADVTNDPETITLYPRGWYEVVLNQPSVDWGLKSVRMVGEGQGWIAGWDTEAGRGVIYRGIENTWGLQLPDAAPANWRLDSIDGGSGSTAWAVGEDAGGGAGLILRYNGEFWYDDDDEPTISDPWRLKGVSFATDGGGWAVGETDTVGGAHEPVVLRYSSGTWVETDVPAGSVSLSDVFALDGGEALMGGFDGTTPEAGLPAYWNGSAYEYPTATFEACGGSPWEVQDVYALSPNDWWAAATCTDEYGIVMHYNGAIIVESPVVTDENWALGGIWANGSGEAWAVGSSDTRPLVLHREGGEWSIVTPDDALTGWKIYSVDFATDGWGYAVGRNTDANSGLLLRYPFPK